jgi:ABC-type transporter Mla subunit MlaD
MKYIIVGLAFFTVLFLSFYYTILEQIDYDKLYPYKIKLYYSKIDGMKIGTDVYINGILSGRVHGIDVVKATKDLDYRYLEPSKKFAIELTVILKEPITLWEDYNIKFRTVTAFSGRSIEIDPGTNPDTVYSKSIKNPSAFYFEDVFLASNELMRENQQNLRNTVSNLKEISQKMNEGSGTIPQIINSDELHCSVEDLITDLSIVGKEARWYAEGNREVETSLTGFIISTSLLMMNMNLLF